jgi:ATP adenylyltransferase/5',5'''-P-1,P-4-tetraphosphate phosphorylase II
MSVEPAEQITKASILAQFDSSVSDKTVLYDAAHPTIPYTTGSVRVTFIITKPFNQKPNVSSAGHAETTKELLPGSDIDIAGYEVCEINNSHVLAFNKFAVYRPHLLLLTKDGYKRQTSDLVVEDFQALWKVLSLKGGDEEEEGKWMGIYNCGKEGGCSRAHKHMQVFPLPEDTRNTMLPSSDPAATSVRPPVRHYSVQLDEGTSHEGVFQIYRAMVKTERRVSQLQEEDHLPHNVLLTKSWIVFLPRRTGDVDGLGLNAASMLGLVAVKDEAEHERWLEMGVEKVLKEAGMPIESAT